MAGNVQNQQENAVTYNPWNITGLAVIFSGTCQKLTGTGAVEKRGGSQFFEPSKGKVMKK